jgi:hypothetical protein
VLRSLAAGTDKKYLNSREEITVLKGLKVLGTSSIASSINIASVADTRLFAMSDVSVIGHPLGAMNTLAHLNDTTRQYYLDYCPELKMIFPSLHNPSCFGAEPDPLGCFQSLCENGGLKCRDIVKDGVEKLRKTKKSDREYESGRAAITWVDSKKGFKLKLTIEKVP